MGFDFHWFKLRLIAVVMLRVTHLCHVYSSCLSFSFFCLPKVVLCMSMALGAYGDLLLSVHIDSVIRDDWISTLR